MPDVTPAERTEMSVYPCEHGQERFTKINLGGTMQSALWQNSTESTPKALASRIMESHRGSTIVKFEHFQQSAKHKQQLWMSRQRNLSDKYRILKSSWSTLATRDCNPRTEEPQFMETIRSITWYFTRQNLGSLGSLSRYSQTSP
jgi:hypothetical protein